jgi:hypothetical protein
LHQLARETAQITQLFPILRSDDQTNWWRSRWLRSAKA